MTENVDRVAFAAETAKLREKYQRMNQELTGIRLSLDLISLKESAGLSFLCEMIVADKKISLYHCKLLSLLFSTSCWIFINFRANIAFGGEEGWWTNWTFEVNWGSGHARGIIRRSLYSSVQINFLKPHFLFGWSVNQLSCRFITDTFNIHHRWTARSVWLQMRRFLKLCQGSVL